MGAWLAAALLLGGCGASTDGELPLPAEDVEEVAQPVLPQVDVFSHHSSRLDDTQRRLLGLPS
jgi:hypothetical protein